MKKFLRFMLVLIIIVVAGILILGMIEPTDIVVKRNIMIKAPKEAVFEQMVTFKNWPNWSPWYKMDPTMKIDYAGTDGQPGSSYHWVGEKGKTGEGEMKNDAVNGSQMDFTVTFKEPRNGTAHGILKAEDTAGMTRATWSFSMHMPYPMNAMCMFMNMDKLLGGDFENGLGNMKTYVEAHAGVTPGIEVKEVDFPAHTYEGIRQTVPMADISKFFMENSGALAKALGPKIIGPSAGLYYTWDTVNKNTDMVIAFPVTDTTVLAKGAAIFYAGPAKAVMAVLKGGYSKEMEYHGAIAKYLSAKNMKRTLTLEEYIAGPGTEPDSNKWVTNIYYLVQ